MANTSERSLRRFHDKVNKDPQFRREFFDSANPGEIVERESGVTFSPSHREEIKRIISEVKQKHATIAELPPGGPEIWG